MNKYVTALEAIYGQYKKKVDFLMSSVKNPEDKKCIASTMLSLNSIHGMLECMIEKTLTKQEEDGNA